MHCSAIARRKAPVLTILPPLCRFVLHHPYGWMTLLHCSCFSTTLVLQTLNRMHLDSEICHMDITPSNVMLQSNPGCPWDAVRLIDFGFAKEFNAGRAVINTRGRLHWFVQQQNMLCKVQLSTGLLSKAVICIMGWVEPAVML